jgi:hypothetical protein
MAATKTGWGIKVDRKIVLVTFDHESAKTECNASIGEKLIRVRITEIPRVKRKPKHV